MFFFSGSRNLRCRFVGLSGGRRRRNFFRSGRDNHANWNDRRGTVSTTVPLWHFFFRAGGKAPAAGIPESFRQITSNWRDNFPILICSFSSFSKKLFSKNVRCAKPSMTSFQKMYFFLDNRFKNTQKTLFHFFLIPIFIFACPFSVPIFS